MGIVFGWERSISFRSITMETRFWGSPCEYWRAAGTLLPVIGSLYAMRAKIGVITTLLGVDPNKTKFTFRIRWTVTIVWLVCKSRHKSGMFQRVIIKDKLFK